MMEHLGDDELWRRAQDGDAEAFGSLFDRYGNAVYGYCFRRTADRAVAEDLTSVVFLEAWRRCRSVALSGGHALPFLFGIATNVVRNQRRALRRYRNVLRRLPPLETEHDFAEDLAARIDTENRMRLVLVEAQRLPRPEQEAIALHWEGLTTAEAAAVLDIPESTFRTRLFRARGRLSRATASGADSERIAPAKE